MELEVLFFIKGEISMALGSMSRWELLQSKHNLLLQNNKKNDKVSMQRIKREFENWREWKRKQVITWSVVAVRWVHSQRRRVTRIQENHKNGVFPKEKMRNRNKEFKGERRSNVKSERGGGRFYIFYSFWTFRYIGWGFREDWISM